MTLPVILHFPLCGIESTVKRVDCDSKVLLEPEQPTAHKTIKKTRTEYGLLNIFIIVFSSFRTAD
jgi:hypothetical protein